MNHFVAQTAYESVRDTVRTFWKLQVSNEKPYGRVMPMHRRTYRNVSIRYPMRLPFANEHTDTKVIPNLGRSRIVDLFRAWKL